jgi:hypothetical protein
MKSFACGHLAALLFVAAAPAFADGAAALPTRYEIYSGIGSQGYVLGGGASFNDAFGVRGEGNYLNYTKNYSSDSVNYDGKLSYRNAGLFVDWHPFRGSFRLTAGALVGDDKVTGSATSSQGSYTINGTSYSAAGQSLSATVKFPTVRPYLGVGFGHTQQRGFGFYSDLGVAYGKPSVDVNASPALQQQAANDIAAEKSDLESKANRLRYMPVLDVGVRYAF